MFAAIDAHSPIAESGLFADAALSHFHSRLLLPSAGFQPCPPISHLCGRQKKREKQKHRDLKFLPMIACAAHAEEVVKIRSGKNPVVLKTSKRFAGEGETRVDPNMLSQE